MPPSFVGGRPRRVLVFGRVPLAVAILIVAILPIGLAGRQTYVGADQALQRAVVERHDVAYAVALIPILEDVHRLRAEESVPGSTADDISAIATRVGVDVAEFEGDGFAADVPGVPCGGDWQAWRTELDGWFRTPTVSAIDDIARRATCYASAHVADSPLSSDPDTAVHLLASIYGSFVPALVDEVGATSSLLREDAGHGFARFEIVAISRSVAGASRRQSDIDTFVADGIANDDAVLANLLTASKKRPLRFEAEFEEAVDQVLFRNDYSDGAVARVERSAVATIDAYDPFWREGLGLLDDRLAAQATRSAERERIVIAVTLLGLVTVPALVVLASRQLARRHEARFERVRLERDALAAQVAQTEAERSLSLTEGQLRVVFETSDVAIAMLDADRRFVQTNAAFVELDRAMPDLENIVRAYAQPLYDGRHARVRADVAVWGDGTEHWIRLSLAGVYDAAECRYTIATLADVTAQKLNEARLRHDASHDALTTLANRAGFEAALDACCADAATPFTLLFVDLDRFKPINDAYGHGTGDEVLIAVAGRIRGLFADRDVVARLGGDEFAVIARDVSERTLALALAERLCDAIERPYAVSDRIVVELSGSVGICVVDDANRAAADIVASADAAMYRAKVLGLRFAIASPSAAGTETQSRI